MPFRKLTDSEIENLTGIKLDSKARKYASIIAHIKKYYPAGGVRAVVEFNSEYNDEYYSADISYLGVYDVLGNEVHPYSITAREGRKQWENLLPYSGSELTEPPDDLLIPLIGTGMPDLYVKE